MVTPEYAIRSAADALFTRQATAYPPRRHVLPRPTVGAMLGAFRSAAPRMPPSRAIFQEARHTLTLAAPMTAGQVGQMLLGFSDS